jgi:hypothetical protein
MKRLFILFALITILAIGASAKTTHYRYALILAYSQTNSVYEDDNIKLEIYNEKLWATNKTTKTIFIDLSQCFAIHNGASKPFVPTGESDKKSKKNEKKASKKGYSNKDDLFMTIAPSMGSKQSETFICYLSTGIYGKYSTIEPPSGYFTDYDKRLYSILEELIDADKKFKPTTSRHLTEDESINNIGASIAYSFNKKSEDWVNVSLSTWVSDVIFAPFYVEKPKKLKLSEKKGFGFKETDPVVLHVKADSPFEFEEDKSPIILCDWVGKYNKGKFTLEPVWITKSSRMTPLQIVGALFTMGLNLVEYDEEIYKSIIHFDGVEADWGTPVYSSSLSLSKQVK